MQPMLRVAMLRPLLVTLLMISAFVDVTHGESGKQEQQLQKRRKARRLSSCEEWHPWLRMEVDAMPHPLADVQNVTVTVSGVIAPHPLDWVAVVSPAEDAIFTEDCPFVKILYLETGDTRDLPLLCHYPIKFQYLKVDAQYLSCERVECSKEEWGVCFLKTCRGSLTFRLINIRSDVEFVFMGHGLLQPCFLRASTPLPFANPLAPLYGHLASVNSIADSVALSQPSSINLATKVTWVSGDHEPQYVAYGMDNTFVKASITTFRQSDMCDASLGPAAGFGWHDPGFIHSALLTGLLPSSGQDYQYGSDKVGWSERRRFRTPPAAGAQEVKVIMYADLGKNERDGSEEHFLQEGALSVIDAVAQAVDAGDVDVVFHVGDISYATGFLVEWDAFLEMIGPVASRVPYMTASGNHERDFPGSGSVYSTPDSGGECGIPYEAYFPMPSQGVDKPWYSVEYGPVHFTVMSTEMPWTDGSEQYTWLEGDLKAVNRSQTPWVIFAGHRPLYSSVHADFILSTIVRSVDYKMTKAIEPLLVQYKVDVATWGHVHQYERTCATQKAQCILKPTKNDDGIDSYNSSFYGGPVHLIIGNAGFHLDQFDKAPDDWSLVRVAEFGYTHLFATHDRLQFQLILAKTGALGDQFELRRFPSPSTQK